MFATYALRFTACGLCLVMALLTLTCALAFGVSGGWQGLLSPVFGLAVAWWVCMARDALRAF